MEPRRLHPLAVAIGRGLIGAGASLLVPAAFAQPAAAPRDIEEVVVIEEGGDRYRVEDNSMSKLSESIRDTPQSIATISKELLEDRGVTSLNDALRNTPGITLGAGEFSWQGNNPTIRGFSARDDLYLDGLRDFGSYRAIHSIWRRSRSCLARRRFCSAAARRAVPSIRSRSSPCASV